jgi:hypothetical protein
VNDGWYPGTPGLGESPGSPSPAIPNPPKAVPFQGWQQSDFMTPEWGEANIIGQQSMVWRSPVFDTRPELGAVPSNRGSSQPLWNVGPVGRLVVVVTLGESAVLGVTDRYNVFAQEFVGNDPTRMMYLSTEPVTQYFMVPPESANTNLGLVAQGVRLTFVPGSARFWRVSLTFAGVGDYNKAQNAVLNVSASFIP